MLYGEWRSKGNREGETLCPLLYSIFNTFLEEGSFLDNADLALGGMALPRSAANIADQLFGWHPRGRGGGFLAHLHSPWGYDEPILQYSNSDFGRIGADGDQYYHT